MTALLNLLRALLAPLAALTGLSALAVGAAALLSRPAPAWSALGFEAVVLLAACFGWHAARARRSPDGSAMALLCVALCIAVASFLGYLGSGRALFGVGLAPLVLARFAVAAAFVLASALEVLRHAPQESLPRLVKGAVALAIPAAVAVLLWRGVGATHIAGLNSTVRATAYFAGFFLFGGLFCAGVHWSVRAFVVALERADAQSAAPGTPSAAGEPHPAPTAPAPPA
jgi:hypothetical protein